MNCSIVGSIIVDAPHAPDSNYAAVLNDPVAHKTLLQNQYPTVTLIDPLIEGTELDRLTIEERHSCVRYSLIPVTRWDRVEISKSVAG